MITWLLAALGCCLIALAFIGCVVPVLPGPLLAYCALLTLVVSSNAPSGWMLGIGAVLLAIAIIVDYVLPTVCAQKFKCSGWGVLGCLLGSFVGLFFLPFGIIMGPFLGTVIGELIAGKAMGPALRGGAGALLGFVVCLVVKFAVVSLFAYWYISALLK